MIVLLLLISVNCSIHAQTESVFVRVYDLSGKKIHNGHVLAVTDTTLQLKGGAKPITIPVSHIGSIKTKRSGGNNFLVGSLAGATAMAIFGIASGNDGAFFYSKDQGAWAGAVVGLPLGAAIGGLTVPLKKSKVFLVDGDLIKWKTFQRMITGRE